jgi:hypothetical protein
MNQYGVHVTQLNGPIAPLLSPAVNQFYSVIYMLLLANQIGSVYLFKPIPFSF